MFPKMGKTFPRKGTMPVSQIEYRSTISAALKYELGGSHRAVKTTMKWTGASERTAKNWISGANGPAGEHLLELVRHSDSVASAVFWLSGRNEFEIQLRLQSAQKQLSELIDLIGTIVDLDGAY